MPDFSFMGNPVVPGQQQPQQMNIGYQPPQVMPQQQMYPAYMQPPVAPQPQQQLPVLTTGNSFGFTVVPDEPEDPKGMLLPVPMETELPEPKKKGRPKKEQKAIIKPDNDGHQEIEDVSALYTYAHTTMMLHETVGQIDMVASELKSELDDIRLSRTARNKYNTMVGLSTALGKLLETKVSAISQINSSISKANDLDYKREKDRKTLEVNQVMDDKRLMDMYQSFVANPMGLENNVSVLGPTAMQTSVAGSSIIRADIPGSTPVQGGIDPGYTNYLNNITPEQNAMFYESNPNVKNCVVYDAATGMKQFQMMDLSTGQVVPNLTPLDNRFMEDTYIDLKNKTASNNNLHQTYPVVVINENVASQY